MLWLQAKEPGHLRKLEEVKDPPKASKGARLTPCFRTSGSRARRKHNSGSRWGALHTVATGEVPSGSSSLLARPPLVRENHPAALLGTTELPPRGGLWVGSSQEKDSRRIVTALTLRNVAALQDGGAEQETWHCAQACQEALGHLLRPPGLKIAPRRSGMRARSQRASRGLPLGVQPVPGGLGRG